MLAVVGMTHQPRLMMNGATTPTATTIPGDLVIKMNGAGEGVVVEEGVSEKNNLLIKFSILSMIIIIFTVFLTTGNCKDKIDKDFYV